MARRNPRREQLLADIAKRQRAVGQKVSRLERRQGVAVRREGLDPRRDLDAVKNLSTPQLHRYYERLDRFMDRSNNWVAGKGGTPIRSATWREYQKAEAAANRQADAWNASVEAIGSKVPTLGQTPGEYRTELDARRKGAKGQRRTFDKANRSPGNLADEAGAKRMARELRNRLDPKWFKKRMVAQRRIVTGMLKGTGDKDLIKKVRALSDAQLNVLIDTTDFMRRLGGKYATAGSSTDRPRWQSEAIVEYSKGMSDLIGWAGKLGAASGEYTDTNARPLPRQFNPLDTRNNPRGISLYTNTSARSIPIQKPGSDGKR